MVSSEVASLEMGRLELVVLLLAAETKENTKNNHHLLLKLMEVRFIECRKTDFG